MLIREGAVLSKDSVLGKEVLISSIGCSLLLLQLSCSHRHLNLMSYHLNLKHSFSSLVYYVGYQ